MAKHTITYRIVMTHDHSNPSQLSSHVIIKKSEMEISGPLEGQELQLHIRHTLAEDIHRNGFFDHGRWYPAHRIACIDFDLQKTPR